VSAVIVTLSKFPDVFEGLSESVELHEPGRKVVVFSGDAHDHLERAAVGWEQVCGVEPFVFARNANLGIRAAAPSDVLLINDDCRLTGPLVAELERLSRENPEFGLIAPQVRGGVGNRFQREQWRPSDLTVSTERLAFVCVFIPRSTLDLVGLLDERFTGYGGDDVDYCHRVRAAGLKLGITGRATVVHGDGRSSFSTSFSRVMTPGERSRSMGEMEEMFRRKHGLGK